MPLAHNKKCNILYKMLHFSLYTSYFGLFQKNLTPYFEKSRITFILYNPQIAFCDMVRGVIINIHQYNRGNPLLPRVVAKCLTQGVAAYVFVF